MCLAIAKGVNSSNFRAFAKGTGPEEADVEELCGRRSDGSIS